MQFHYYFVLKDLYGVTLLAIVVSTTVFIYPYLLGDAENFKQANPLVTPVHIQPEWYFLYAYAILRSIPNKLGGVVALFSSFLILFLLPILGSNYLRGLAFRPLSKILYFFLVGNFVVLT